MNQNALLGLAVLLAVAAAALTSVLLRPAAEPELQPTPGRVDSAQRLQRQLEELQARLDRLETGRAAANTGATAGAGSARTQVIDDAALEAAVERVLVRLRREAAATASEGEAARQRDGAELLRQLSAVHGDDAAQAAAWRRIREGGHIDLALAEFERRAEAAPNDAKAQAELARAYFEKMQTTRGGPEAGRWGAKGAQQLQRSLELDADDWDTRWALAQHYYWADMRGDSVAQLERLIRGPNHQSAQPQHAAAWLLLGNIHFDAGQKAAAKAVWQQGLAAFPADAQLRARLQQLQ